MPKANYDLPDEKIKQVMKLSGAKTKREALLIALDNYTKTKKIEALINSYGKISLKWTKKTLKKYRA